MKCLGLEEMIDFNCLDWMLYFKEMFFGVFLFFNWVGFKEGGLFINFVLFIVMIFVVKGLLLLKYILLILKE